MVIAGLALIMSYKKLLRAWSGEGAVQCKNLIEKKQYGNSYMHIK